MTEINGVFAKKTKNKTVKKLPQIPPKLKF